MEQGIEREQSAIDMVLIQVLADGVRGTVRPVVDEDGEGCYFDYAEGECLKGVSGHVLAGYGLIYNTLLHDGNYYSGVMAGAIKV